MSYTLEDLVEYNEVAILKKVRQSKAFCRVLLCLNLANPSFSAKEISDRLKMDISFVRNTLYMMQAMGLVIKTKATHKLVMFSATRELKNYVNPCCESLGIIQRGEKSGS